MKAFMLTSGVGIGVQNIKSRGHLSYYKADRKWKGNTLTSGCSVSGQSEL